MLSHGREVSVKDTPERSGPGFIKHLMTESSKITTGNDSTWTHHGQHTAALKPLYFTKTKTTWSQRLRNSQRLHVLSKSSSPYVWQRLHVNNARSRDDAQTDGAVNKCVDSLQTVTGVYGLPACYNSLIWQKPYYKMMVFSDQLLENHTCAVWRIFELP